MTSYLVFKEQSCKICGCSGTPNPSQHLNLALFRLFLKELLLFLSFCKAALVEATGIEPATF